MSKHVKRLYTQFEPEHYDISIDIAPDKKTFSGSVTIRGRKTWRPNKRIVLHQNGLKITHAMLTLHDKKGDHHIELSRIYRHRSLHEVRLHTVQTLYPGVYTISLTFEAPLTDHMHGIYPSKYVYEGKDKSIISTQFESHHAREVFPCIDEPEAKATFQLTLTSADSETVLSNTPIAKQTKNKKRMVTIFEPTPRMSTYLLAFAVGELHYHEATTKTGTTVRSWSTIAQPKSSLIYPTLQAVRILEFFTDYFGTDFPLPKLDQVALPDFESGAMENWGLITYREIALLSDQKNRSLSTEQYVSLVVAHEMSHQWFGNLVTMKWWDDLWLNESFASIMEHVALSALEPSWEQWEQYAASDVIVTSNRDIYSAVQAVRTDVNNPEEINTLFDPAIVYAKGGRLLKMLIDYIGEDDFKAGLKKYFKKHAYANTTRDDLWAVLSEASGKDIKALMDPWLEKPGLPVVTVGQSKHAVTLHQERFLLDSTGDSTKWTVPLFTNQPIAPAILTQHSEHITIENPDPLLINIRGSGHYIAKYDSAKTHEYILESFTNNVVRSEGKINFLNDTLLLARRGDYSLTAALDIVAANRSEMREAVWTMMARVLGQASLLTEGNGETEESMKLFKRTLARPLYDNLGWKDLSSDDPNTMLLRHLIIGILVGADDPEIIERCLESFKNAGSADALPADIRPAILTAVVRHGDKAARRQLIQEYQSSPNPDTQLAICLGLTDTRDQEFAKKLIHLSISKDGFVRSQDILRWFAYLMRNKHTREFAWDWLVSHWDYLRDTMGAAKMFDDIPSYAAMAISTPEWEKKYTDFFTPHLGEPALTRNITIAFAEIAARVAWHKRDAKAISSWIKQAARRM